MKELLRSRWDQLRAALKPPRSLRFTPLGTYVVLLTVGIGLAAMNTGNNLVYMVFGMMLGFITASGALSEISLRGLEAEWAAPADLHAGRPASLRLTLRNRKKRMPSFGILIETALAPARSGALGKSQIPLEHSFLLIPNESQASRDFEWTPPARGEYRFTELKIETRFPFGFFRKFMMRPVERSFVVYPRLVPVDRFDFERTVKERRDPTAKKGPGDGFWGMREWTSGDDARMIAWKTSAKQSRMIVRETEKDAEKRITLALGPEALWKRLSPQELEAAVSFAASFAHQCFREGFAVGFSSGELELKPSAQRRNLSLILRYLALFQPHSERKTSAAAENRKRDPDLSLEMIYLWKKTLASRRARTGP